MPDKLEPDKLVNFEEVAVIAQVAATLHAAPKDSQVGALTVEAAVLKAATLYDRVVELRGKRGRG